MKKNETKQGSVYVLSNPSMPGIVKIGVTQDSVENRRKAISKATGVPTPFEVEYECTVDDCYKVEKALQAAFAPYRVNENREFFKVTAAQVITILQLVQIENTTKEATADQPETRRNPRFKFAEMNIPVGAELVFTQDETIKAIVTANNNVVRVLEDGTCDGREQALSPLSSELIGYVVRPLQYWTYNGRNLLEIYNATYVKR